MKKYLRLLLSIILIFGLCMPIKAEESTVVQEATELLNSALSRNELFGISNLSKNNVYLSNPIKYSKKDSTAEYILDTVNEYYLVYTDDSYIAGIIVTYDENHQIISTTFDTSVAMPFNKHDIENDSFVFTSNQNEYALEIVDQSQKVDFPREAIQSISKLTNIYPSYSSATRSGRVLNLAFVEQDSGHNSCWACAALSFGWYYYPNKCVGWDEIDVMSGTGGSALGGNIATTKNALSLHFGISAIHTTSVISKSTIINNINTGKPMIVGYRPTSGMGHIVILAGYDATTSSSSVKYYFRDSLQSTYKIVSSTSSPTTYVSGGVTMNWADALYK